MKRWWVILLLLVAMGVDQYAAVLTVMYADVELLRAGAENWLPLRAGAINCEPGRQAASCWNRPPA